MTAWDTFEDSRRRIEEAIRAGTMEAGDETHFTWTPLLLDEVGWKTVVAGIDGLSRHVAEEAVRAESRMAKSGERPFPVTAVLAAFESPLESDQVCSPAGERQGGAIAGPPEIAEVPLPSSPRAQALAGPLRLDIMEAARKKDVSPASFVAERGGITVLEVDHHFEALRKHGWLRQVESQEGGSARGRAERLYRVRSVPVFGRDVWSALPSSIRAVINAWGFESYVQRVSEAMEAGTLDAREDGRFGCTPVLLDRLGWKSLFAKIYVLFRFLFGEQARAKLRLAQSGEEPFVATVVLMAFESPGGPRKPPRQLGDLRQAPPRYSPATSAPTLRLLK
jgi:DNA-binding transcriptional ArsR family regulator